MKKIFVTGGNGMVGKNLVSSLEKEYDIFAPSRQELDLLNFKKTNDYIKNTQPDIIIHCAGKVGGIQANINNPFEFFDINLKIGQSIINAAMNNGISNFLNLSSSCIYRPDSKTPLKEESILTAGLEKTNEGYALAKISILKYCEYISKQHNLFFKTIIPCNLYGDHDKFDSVKSHLIPAIILKIDNAIKSKQKEVEIWGDGTAKREFMYVGDLVNFIHYFLKNFQKMPFKLNVGVEKDYSINEYYNVIGKIMGYAGTFIHNLDKPVGMKRKKVDISKLNEVGWKSSISLNEGVKKTISFYEKNKV